MANAKKCDRCGSLYEKYDGIKFGEGGWAWTYISLKTNWSSYSTDYDLCPECMKSLIKWMKEETNGQTT